MRTPLASGDTGVAFVDLVIALTIVLTLGGLVMPAAAEVIDASRARQAAGFMASQFRLARLRIVASARSVGLVFDQIGARWTFRICTDGNGNGLRRSELVLGQDVCAGDPADVTALFPGMAIGVDPRLPGPAGEPGSGDPVRFGARDILSFSAAVTCTAGTLFLQSASGTQYAVRISNVTPARACCATRRVSGRGCRCDATAGAHRPRRAGRGRTARRAQLSPGRRLVPRTPRFRTQPFARTVYSTSPVSRPEA